MYRNVNSDRNPFAFSVGGIKTIGAFMAPWAVADDRINSAISERKRAEAIASHGEKSNSVDKIDRSQNRCPVHELEDACLCHAA